MTTKEKTVTQNRQIHLLWKGPYAYKAVRKMNKPTDYGVYRIYGIHPVYGPDTLLHIGQANGGTFGARFETGYKFMTDDWGENTGNFRIYTGRIHKIGDDTPPADEEWAELIRTAEKLLINTHSPAWNGQDVGGLKNSDTELYENYHVFNWGQFARLLPEVSGARHTFAVWNKIHERPLRVAD